jgi:hypothetical protein
MRSRGPANRRAGTWWSLFPSRKHSLSRKDNTDSETKVDVSMLVS